MNRKNVTAARNEAKRFIAACDALLAVNITHYDHETRQYLSGTWQTTHDSAPVQTGAVRRASMDLTRSLSAMRKP